MKLTITNNSDDEGKGALVTLPDGSTATLGVGESHDFGFSGDSGKLTVEASNGASTVKAAEVEEEEEVPAEEAEEETPAGEGDKAAE